MHDSLVIALAVICGVLVGTSAIARPQHVSKVFLRNAEKINIAFARGEISWAADRRAMPSDSVSNQTEGRERRDGSISLNVDLRRPCSSPVRNQGNCGSCYAFALTATMADQACLDGQHTDVLSPQFVMDCMLQREAGNGCEGASLQNSGLFAMYGTTSDACWPYVASSTASCPSMCVSSDLSPQLIAYKTPLVAMGYQQYLTALRTGHVILTSFHAFTDWMSYSSGIYHRFVDESNKAQGGHMIEIVGHGIEAGKAYWTVRNSWGDTWGENGFFRMAAGVNECGIEEAGVLLTNSMKFSRDLDGPLFLANHVENNQFWGKTIGAGTVRRLPTEAERQGDEYLAEAESLAVALIVKERAGDLEQDACEANGESTLQSVKMTYAETQIVEGISYRIELILSTPSGACRYRAVVDALFHTTGVWSVNTVLLEPLPALLSAVGNEQILAMDGTLAQGEASGPSVSGSGSGADSKGGMMAGIIAGCVGLVLVAVLAVVIVRRASLKRRSAYNALLLDDSLSSSLATQDS